MAIKAFCVRCGKEFLALRDTNIYCSGKCLREVTLEKNKKRIPSDSNGGMRIRLRFEILERDGFRCHYCGANPHNDPEVRLVVDHIIPVSKGGKTEALNLITACETCNAGKSDRIINGEMFE